MQTRIRPLSRVQQRRSSPRTVPTPERLPSSLEQRPTVMAPSMPFGNSAQPVMGVCGSSRRQAHACRSELWPGCSLSISSRAPACNQSMCVSACSGKTKRISVESWGLVTSSSTSFNHANPSRRCSPSVSVRRALRGEVLSALGVFRIDLAGGGGLGD